MSAALFPNNLEEIFALIRFGEGIAAHLAILGALLALALMLAPWAIAASLRISING